MKIRQLEPFPLPPVPGNTTECCCSKEAGNWEVEVRGNGWNEDIYLTCPFCGETFKNIAGFPDTCPACGAGMKTEGA